MATENSIQDSELEARYDKYKGIIKNFTLMSDIFMRNVFKQRECLEYVLQVIMEKHDIETVICFSKKDLAKDSQLAQMADIYAGCGCRVHFISTVNKEGIDDIIRPIIAGKTTVFAGPSGVGKSSLTNELLSQSRMETGAVSEKIGRGRHTTRHSEIINIGGDTYIMDTPGFTSFYVSDIEAQELRFYFEEFAPYEGRCRFNGCVHVNEPDCAVKKAVDGGIISRIRYENYVEIYNELKDQRKY